MGNLGCICDGVEFIEAKLLNKVKAMSKLYTSFGIGVYSDEIFEKLYGRRPLKTYRERVKLASCIKGVDFVFKANRVNDEPNGDFEEGTLIDVEFDHKQPYQVVYAPGTYDLLHEGHFEHLLQCRSMGKILVVGVKSDQNVFETKGKKTRQNERERLFIMRNVRFIDYVILVTSRNKQRANEMIRSLTGAPIDLVMLGSDCKGQEEIENPDGLPFLFTERDPQIAKRRSSSFYREQIEKHKIEQRMKQ